MQKLLVVFFLLITGAKCFAQNVPAASPPPTPKENPDKVYNRVEIEPSFKGNWVAFLQTNLQYPKQAVKKKIQGAVLIDFVVEVNGTVTNLKVADESPQQNTLLVNEAIRVIKLTSGKWSSAYQNGKNVRSYHQQKITFVL